MNASWAKTQLSDLLARSDETAVLEPEREYREITVKLWGKGVTSRGVVTGAEIAAERRNIARRGQFILSRIDARNGALGIVPPELDGAVVTNDFPVFHLREERLLPEYLGWMCRTRGFVEECKKASEGTTNRVRLQERQFLAREISLPPLAEQRSVVARIEELCGQIQEARKHRSASEEATCALMEGVTSDALDQLTDFPLVPLRTLGEGGGNPIQTGPFGAQLHASEFVTEGVPVLNVGNVWPEGLRVDHLDYVLPEKANQLARYAVRSGDLLFARSGATLGKVCILPTACDGWLMTGHLFRVRFDEGRVLNQFAFAALRHARSVREQIFGQVRGATRPGFNTTLLGNVQLRVPTLDVQHRVVERLNEIQLNVDALRAAQHATSRELDALLPSILDRAFHRGSS